MYANCQHLEAHNSVNAQLQKKGHFDLTARTAKLLTLSPLTLQIPMLRPHALAALQPITPEDFALLFPLPAPADLIGRSLAFCTAWADTEGQS